MILKKLLSKNPQHGNGTLGMARILADKVQMYNSKNENDKAVEPMQDSIELYEKAVKLVKEVRILCLLMLSLYSLKEIQFE